MTAIASSQSTHLPPAGLKADYGDVNQPADEDFIRKAIDTSNLNVLRMALLQVTGDQELAEMRTKRHAIRGGAMFAHILAEEDAPKLKEKALAYLSKRRLDDPIPAPPSKSETKKLVDIFGDEPVEDRVFEYDYEELAFDEFPREAAWSDKRPSPEKIADFKILVIGAGISGISSAVQFKRLGLNFEVIERQGGVGGTWLLNAYPEARVDTSSYLFQFKFVKNYPWSEFFATAGETRRYLENVVDEYNVRDHFHFNREVVHAVWKEDISRWELTLKTSEGTTEVARCNVVVSGSGLFATPNIPNIKGINDFKGAVFHTAKWDHTVDYKNKRVALLGTGSTGTQLAATVAAASKHFTVYQRTPNWIMNLEGYRAPRTKHTCYMFDRMPYYWNWYCYGAHVASQQLQYLQEVDPAWQAKGGLVNERNDLARQALTDYIRSKCEHIPGMVDKVLPKYPPLVRRLVVDNGFYDMLSRDNTELVAEDIECLTEKGIRSKDGIEREFDVIILGTGFKTSQYFWPCQYVGREGKTLEDLWKKDGPRSYLGLTMPGFPNFFSLYGPNHQPRSGGFYSWSEIWVRYIAQSILHLIENGKNSMDVRKDVFDEYNKKLDEKTAGLIWEFEGSGYYVNEHGRQSVNAPWHTADYHGMVTHVNLDDFEVR